MILAVFWWKNKQNHNLIKQLITVEYDNLVNSQICTWHFSPKMIINWWFLCDVIKI